MENHVVCIPFPAQGHIRPMLKLAQFLHFRFDFNVTFINTHHNHQTLLNNHPLACSNENNLKSTFFKFESLTEGDNPKDFLSILNSVVNNELELPLKELLMSKLSSSHNNSNNNGNSKNCSQSRISYMISDVVMSSFTLKVAEELEIPAVLLETASACSLLACFNYRHLLDRGIIPLQDKSCLTNGYLEKEIDCIPSLKGICLKDMPSFIRTTDPNDMMLNIVMLNAHRALNNQSRAIIFNTFDALEQDSLKELSSINPNIYPIGPLNLLVDYHISKNDTINIGSNNNDLHEKTRDDDHNNEYYMHWLDSQESNSVLYISLGSIVDVSQETLIELAWGVAKSGAKFLWIIRSDQVTSNKGNDSVEFDRFEEEIKGRSSNSSKEAIKVDVGMVRLTNQESPGYVMNQESPSDLMNQESPIDFMNRGNSSDLVNYQVPADESLAENLPNPALQLPENSADLEASRLEVDILDAKPSLESAVDTVPDVSADHDSVVAPEYVSSCSELSGNQDIVMASEAPNGNFLNTSLLTSEGLAVDDKLHSDQSLESAGDSVLKASVGNECTVATEKVSKCSELSVNQDSLMTSEAQDENFLNKAPQTPEDSAGLEPSLLEVDKLHGDQSLTTMREM